MCRQGNIRAVIIIIFNANCTSIINRNTFCVDISGSIAYKIVIMALSLILIKIGFSLRSYYNNVGTRFKTLLLTLYQVKFI